MTTTTWVGDSILLEDPETGKRRSFTEFIEQENLVETETSYGTVWLDPIPLDPVVPDGIAYMVENCKSLTASDLARREGLKLLHLVCYEP